MDEHQNMCRAKEEADSALALSQQKLQEALANASAATLDTPSSIASTAASAAALVEKPSEVPSNALGRKPASSPSTSPRRSNDSDRSASPRGRRNTRNSDEMDSLRAEVDYRSFF